MTARQAALAALERCRRDGAWSSETLDGMIGKYSLDGRDAALASAITLGVLQNESYCDFIIGSYCSRSVDKLEPKLRDILRIGVCQLLFLDRIPPRAAVNETVALCADAGLSRASGLVNAVLRRVCENLGDLPRVAGEGADRLSVRYSQPLWFAEKMIGLKGLEFTEELFREFNRPSATDLQINTLRTDMKSFTALLDAAGAEYSIPEFPENCVRLKGGAVRALPGYAEGLFFVQDRAARAAVGIAELRPGMRVLDACASPGGKSFAAAIDMRGEGEIVSCDIKDKKLALIDGGAERLGISIIRTEKRDAALRESAYEDYFDAVIADVPCSGFGVAGKKPEIRKKSPDDLSALPGIQRRILDNLSDYVKPGGVLLYSTCTILPEENEEIIEGFLKRRADFEPCAFFVGGRRSSGGCYTFYPNTDGTDGFFAAKLRRKGK